LRIEAAALVVAAEAQAVDDLKGGLAAGTAKGLARGYGEAAMSARGRLEGCA
jgi:hypothetical protein